MKGLYTRFALQSYMLSILFYTIIYMIMVLLPGHMSGLGIQNTEIGLVMGTSAITTMLFRPLAGKITDKLGFRKVLLIVLVLLPFILLGFFIPSLIMFASVQAFIGMIAAFFSTAIAVLTIQTFNADVRGQGLSLSSLASILPTTFGPAIALYGINFMSFEKICVFFIIIAISNFLALKFLPPNESRRDMRDVNAVNVTQAAWKNPVFITASFTILLISISNGAIFTFLPLYFKEIGEPSISLYFLVQNSVLAISRFVCAKFIDRHTKKYTSIVILLINLCALGTFIISVSNQFAWFIVAAVLNGVAFSTLYPLLVTLVSFSISDKGLGFWLSIFIGFADLGVALGSLIMGLVVEKNSFSMMYQLCSCLSFTAGILFIYLIKAQKRNKLKNLTTIHASQ